MRSTFHSFPRRIDLGGPGTLNRLYSCEQIERLIPATKCNDKAESLPGQGGCGFMVAWQNLHKKVSEWRWYTKMLWKTKTQQLFPPLLKYYNVFSIKVIPVFLTFVNCFFLLLFLRFKLSKIIQWIFGFSSTFAEIHSKFGLCGLIQLSWLVSWVICSSSQLTDVKAMLVLKQCWFGKQCGSHKLNI